MMYVASIEICPPYNTGNIAGQNAHVATMLLM